MTLEELHKRASDARLDVVEFCDSVGFNQMSTDLMINLEDIPRTNAVLWSKVCASARVGTSDRAKNTEIMRKKIVSMSRAIDIYVYARKHGVEAAMIWRLSCAS